MTPPATIRQKCFAGVGVALLYAHWEGFVKAAGTLYVEFVSRRGLHYRQLRANFAALGMKGHISQTAESSRGRHLTTVADFFINHLDDEAKLDWKGAVQTKANLSAERLQDILAILGQDYLPFQVRERTVIERLLEQRNSIAHGRYLDVEHSEFAILHMEVIDMLEEIRGQIQDAAQNETYRRT